MAYNAQQKLFDNIEAIRMALEWQAEENLSADQADALKKYAGFGGIKAILFPNAPIEEWQKLNASENDLRLYPKIIELHGLLQKHFNEKEYKEIIASLRN